MGNVHTAAKQKSQEIQQEQGKVQATISDEEIAEALKKNESEWALTSEQKQILWESWRCLQSNIESVGTVTFLKMFETHPETLKPFIPEVERLQELELNEWYRENLKVHAIRVMAVIEKTMHRLDDEVRAAKILSTYGARHYTYGVTPTMLDKMAHSFLIAIQPSLEDKWTKKMEESWLALFRRITFFMVLGYPAIPEEPVSSHDHRERSPVFSESTDPAAHLHNNHNHPHQQSHRHSFSLCHRKDQRKRNSEKKVIT